jgi:3-deoxy-D-manno-octulosonic acid kinase
MTKDGGQRIATARGAMLADPDSLGRLTDAGFDALFEPTFWARRGELVDVTGGRGAAWFIAAAPHQWVLRHYRRGGFVARLSTDRYLWAGEEHVRAFAEWRLLQELTRRELPVPKPIAARYRREGIFYRCDLITQRISDAHPLSAALSLGPLPEGNWRDIGAAVARLHAAGADHADLNAHNILLDGGGAVSVIDFDRGRLRAPGEQRAGAQWRVGAWRSRNLSRLHRSLAKVTRDLPPDRFSAAAWEWLLAGYASAPVRGFVK